MTKSAHTDININVTCENATFIVRVCKKNCKIVQKVIFFILLICHYIIHMHYTK